MWLAVACGARVTGFYYSWMIDGPSWQEMGRQTFLEQMCTSGLHGDSGLLLLCTMKANLPASLWRWLLGEAQYVSRLCILS